MENTVGQRIRQLRDAKKVSVPDLAKIADVGPSAIYGLEKDANKPSYDVLQRLISHFPDLNPDWLLLGTGPMLRDGKALSPVESRPQPDPPVGGSALRLVPRTEGEDAAYWRSQYEREVDAHERTRNQGHERESLLICRIGGKALTSADAADPTNTTKMLVSHVNPDQVAAQAFLRRRAATHAPAVTYSRLVVQGFVAS